VAGSRDNFSLKTIALLQGEAGCFCANPNCLAFTIGAKLGDDEGVIKEGRAAHITAAARGGKRYDENLTPQQRKHSSNGIWLCNVCAAVVDDDDKEYPVEKLRAWKAEARRRSNGVVIRHERLFDVLERARILAPEAISVAIDLEALWSRAAAAAGEDLKGFLTSHRWPTHAIELTVRMTDRDRMRFDSRALAEASISYPEIVLVAPPGTGKSTTLLQLAQAIQTAGAQFPVFVPLAEWSRQSSRVLASVAQRRAFRGTNVSLEEIEACASVGRVALILDGWNELDHESQERLRLDLDQLQREVPLLSIVMSTRRQAVPVPLEEATFFELEALSEAQQAAMAVGIRGEDGEKLLDQARRTPGVRELITVPLYLTVLMSRSSSSAFPTTKEQVLRQFVEEHDQDPRNATVLRSRLFGGASTILTSLAVEMTAVANTSVAEGRARTVVSETVADLRANGQLTQPIEPMFALDTLVGHHVLVRPHDGADVSFQHQQIQEWFAAAGVERTMLQSTAGNAEATRQLRVDILDRPAWEESILFAVERMARGDVAEQQSVAAAILLALEIDPMLGATMISRGSEEVWRIISDRVKSYCGSWHEPGEADRAFLFMLRTGRPEFADLVWSVLAKEGDRANLQSILAPSELRMTVLGDQIEKRLAAISMERRGQLLSDFATRVDFGGLELVTNLAVAEPSNDIKQTVVEALAFRRADRFAARVLRSGDNELWASIAEKGFPEESTDPEIDTRLKADRRSLRDAEPDLSRRLYWLLHDEELRPEAAQLTPLLTSPEFDARGQRESNLIHEAFEIHPKVVSAAMVSRLSAGLSLPFRSSRYIMASDLVAEDGPFVDAVIGAAKSEEFAKAAANVIGPITIGKLIDESIALHTKWGLDHRAFSKSDQTRLNLVRDILGLTRPAALADAILARPDETDPGAIYHLAHIVHVHGRSYARETQQVPAPQKTALTALLKKWGQTLLATEPFNRSSAGELARAFTRFPSETLLPTLVELLRRDLAVWAAARAAVAGSRPNDSNTLHEARTGHTYQYRDAFIALGGSAASEALREFLPEPEFGFHGAVAILQTWAKQQGLEGERGIYSPTFANAPIRRADRAADASPPEESSYATAMFEIADQLGLPEAAPIQRQLALSLAQIAVGLPRKDRTETIAKLLKLPGPRTAKLGLLSAMAMDGVVVRAEDVQAGIDDYVDDVKTKSWLYTQNAFEVELWLQLFAFSDRPLACLEALDHLPPELDKPKAVSKLLEVLAYADAEQAEAILAAVTKQMPEIRGDYNWSRAYERLDTLSALNAILDAMEAEGRLGSGVPFGRSRGLAAMIRRGTPEMRSAVYAQYLALPRGRRRSTLGRAIAETTHEDGIVTVIEGAAAEGASFEETNLEFTLNRAILNVTGEMSGFQTMDIASEKVASMRRRLFRMSLEGGPKAQLARQALTAIDCICDQYDWHPLDPRHPDIGMEQPWPMPV
jgi:hypothetical protein